MERCGLPHLIPLFQFLPPEQLRSCDGVMTTPTVLHPEIFSRGFLSHTLSISAALQDHSVCGCVDHRDPVAISPAPLLNVPNRRGTAHQALGLPCRAPCLAEFCCAHEKVGKGKSSPTLPSCPPGISLWLLSCIQYPSGRKMGSTGTVPSGAAIGIVSRAQQVSKIHIWHLCSLVNCKHLHPLHGGVVLWYHPPCRKGPSVCETKIWESPSLFFIGMNLHGINYFFRRNV